MNEVTEAAISSGSERAIGEEGRGGVLGKVAGRADGGKNIMHTIDPAMLMAWGDVLAFGAKKYHQRNFMVAPGMAWSRVYDSLQRHLLAFWAGEWNDPESGLPHLAHVMCNLQFLWTYSTNEQYGPSDDRPSSVEYQGRTYADWEEAFRAASSPEIRDPSVDEVASALHSMALNRGLHVPDILGALARSSGRSRPRPVKDEEPGHYGQHRGRMCHVITGDPGAQRMLRTASNAKVSEVVRNMVKLGKARLLDASFTKGKDMDEFLDASKGEKYLYTVNIPLKGE